MKVFTISHKIRFWENVRSISFFKQTIQNNIPVDCDIYVIKEDDFSYDFEFIKFELNESEDKIIFKKQVIGYEAVTDEISWTSMEDHEREENYSAEEINLMSIAISKYGIEQCKVYENYKNDIDAPEDFPQIERKDVTYNFQVVSESIVKEVTVEKYES
jgi:hypothetical protein